MKTIKALVAVAAVVALAGLAQAQTVTYSSSMGSGTYSQTETIGGFQPNNTVVDLTFNAFDTGGGARTLTSVTVETTLSTWGGSFGVQNLSGSTASPVTVKFGATAGLASTDVNLSGLTTSSSTIMAYTQGTSGTLAKYGDEGDTFSVIGPSSGSPKTYSTGLQNVTGNSHIQSYTVDNVGAATFGMTLTANGYQYYTGSNLHEEIDPMSAGGAVTVIYHYTGSPLPVPEPASVGLLVVGGLAVVLRRRFMKKA